MKIIIIILILFSLSSCKKDETLIISNNATTQETEIVNEVEEYIDDNPLNISLYLENSLGFERLNNEIELSWVSKKDIIVLCTFYSNDEFIKLDFYQNIWKNYASNIENINNYKIGWEISFDTTEGRIHKTIHFPKDTIDFYDYLEIYLYDSLNQEIGAWYSHLLDEQINDNTLLTTIKLTCGNKCNEITSDIYVKVFSYNGNDDFDDYGFYRGSSYSNLIIKKSNQ
ncbi:MAG: hypothetical protein ACI4XR_03820 [Bacilli bacterium]